MAIANQKITQPAHQAVQAWFNAPPNQGLLHSEQQLLENFSRDVFGYHMLQVQDIGHGLQPFADCPIQQKWQINMPQTHASNSHLYAASEYLPIASDSVDLVVLSHTLDFALDPQQVLREVERVLIPEGRVIILCFNPLSRLGLMRYLPSWRNRVPYQGHFLSYHRLHDWLGLLGFTIELSDVLPVSPGQNICWVRRWLPALADVYALRAVKRVSTIRPIRLKRWQRLRIIDPRLVEPSTRKASQNRNQIVTI